MDNETLAERMAIGFQSVHLQLAEVKRTAEEARDQARTTNGRVTKLEEWRVYLDGMSAGAGLWKYVVALGVTAFNVWIALSR